MNWKLLKKWSWTKMIGWGGKGPGGVQKSFSRTDPIKKVKNFVLTSFSKVFSVQTKTIILPSATFPPPITISPRGWVSVTLYPPSSQFISFIWTPCRGGPTPPKNKKIRKKKFSLVECWREKIRYRVVGGNFSFLHLYFPF